MSFNPAHVRQYLDLLGYAAQQAMEAMGGRSLIEGPVNLAVRAIVPIPASLSKKKTELALYGAIRPLTRPDLSNYVKLAEDALNLVVWRDDAQVVSYDGSGKWYGAQPRLEMEVTPLDMEALMAGALPKVALRAEPGPARSNR